MFLLGFRRKSTALALCKSIESAIQWFQIHNRIAFATVQNPAVYLSGARVSIFSILDPPLVRPRCEVAPILTLNAPVATKVVCFSRLLKFLRSLYGKQWTQIRGAVCSGSTLFASILRFVSNVRQLFTTDDIFRCIFSWRLKG